MEMGDRVDFTTPKGRLIFGDPWKMERLDYEGNVKTVKSGPNAGQERPEYVLGLAILKSDPDVEVFRTAIHTVGQRDYPDVFDGALGIKPGLAFALKYVDGDSQIPNQEGNKPCEKPNFPGCYVFTFKTARPLKKVTTGGLAEILDPEQLRTGDWVRIAGKMVGNGQTGRTAGIYLNPETVEFQHRGDSITGATDPKKAFAAPAAGGIPQGATNQVAPAAPPVTPATVAPPANQVAPAAPTANQVAPQAPTANQVAPQAPPVTPHNAITNPPPTLDERLSDELKAQGVTWAIMLAANPPWTEKTAEDAGHLLPF